MKVLYYFCSKIMPLSDAILDTFDKVIADITYLPLLSESFSKLTPDDIVVCSIHTCAGVKQICDCANDCGIDINFHLRKIDDEHKKGDTGGYEYNRDIAIPKILQEYGYSRIYFGEEWDEIPPPTSE